MTVALQFCRCSFHWKQQPWWWCRLSNRRKTNGKTTKCSKNILKLNFHLGKLWAKLIWTAAQRDISRLLSVPFATQNFLNKMIHEIRTIGNYVFLLLDSTNGIAVTMDRRERLREKEKKRKPEWTKQTAKTHVSKSCCKHFFNIVKWQNKKKKTWKNVCIFIYSNATKLGFLILIIFCSLILLQNCWITYWCFRSCLVIFQCISADKKPMTVLHTLQQQQEQQQQQQSTDIEAKLLSVKLLSIAKGRL